MGVGPPGCCNCPSGGTCNAVISVTARGCPVNATDAGLGSSLFPGATVAWNQVATGTSGSGTTDGSGNVQFTFQNTGQVDFTVSATRYTTLTFSITPVCNHTTTSVRLLVPATGYACLPGGCGRYCKYPLNKTMFLTSPATGATLTMLFVSGAWSVSELVTVSPVCDLPGSHAVNFAWSFDGCFADGHLVCSGGDGVTGCSNGGIGCVATYSAADVTVSTSSLACPVPPGIFTANGSFSNMYFSGSWAITE